MVVASAAQHSLLTPERFANTFQVWRREMALVQFLGSSDSFDRMFAWIISAGGLGVIGLLLGFLDGLWTRGRISFSIVFAAIAIPSCLFGWFISGKAGRWDVAWWFGLCGMMVMTVFFARAISRIGNRDGEARID